MTIWFTSDLHLFHDRDFIFENRGFTAIDCYSNNIIANINEVVAEDDTLYILGDLVLNNNEAGINLLKKIKCQNIKVILGNHDTPNRRKLYEQLPNFKVIGYASMFFRKKVSFYLSHYPTVINNSNDKPVYCLCGHTHTTNKFEHMSIGSYHVDLDCHDNFPVSLDEIILDIKEWRANNAL